MINTTIPCCDMGWPMEDQKYEKGKEEYSSVYCFYHVMLPAVSHQRSGDGKSG